MALSIAGSTTKNKSSSGPPSEFPKYILSHRCPLQPIYVTNHLTANALIPNLPLGPIGFDLEWRPNHQNGQPQNPVALVQLATASTVLLLHIQAMSTFPSALRCFLDSVDWIKVGVGIQYDCKKLFNDYRVSVRHCVDLALFARSVDNVRWKGPYTASIGLARLLETYEKTTLDKGRVQRSNWARLPLTTAQQEYAACDAHAAYTIYHRLEAMKQAAQSAPEPTYYSFSCISGTLFDHYEGRLRWVPHNPNYDPGPPPPPREPKDTAKDQDQMKLPPVPPLPLDFTAPLTDRLLAQPGCVLSTGFLSIASNSGHLGYDMPNSMGTDVDGGAID